MIGSQGKNLKRCLGKEVPGKAASKYMEILAIWL